MGAPSRLAVGILIAIALCFVALFGFALKATSETSTSFPSEILHSISSRIEEHKLMSKQNTNAPQLSKQLVQKYAVNNTVIVAFANAHHIDYAFNWLSYIHALNITSYIVGAMDSTTADALAEHGVHQFAMYGNRAAKGLAELPAGDLPFFSPGFLSIGLHKLALIRILLSYKLDVVLSDLDTVWLQNPLPFFARFPEAHILASSDAVAPSHEDGGLEDPQLIGRAELNIGLMMMRYTKNVTRFVEAWGQVLQLKDVQHWDQAEFNLLVKVNMFREHPTWWDQTDRCDKIFKPLAVLPSNKRIVWGWDHAVTVGVLPISMFASGHVFFTQKLHQKLQSSLHVIHTNFVAGGHKINRLRDSQLWQSDPPAYFAVDRLLDFDLRTLHPPPDWAQMPTKARVRFHIENIATQLDQFWAAAAAAIALSRVLVLPRFACYCDEHWWWSLEVAAKWQCRYIGAVNQTLPFDCPIDTILNLMNANDDPAHFGVPFSYRESTFLQNPRTPDATKADVMRIKLQMPAKAVQRTVDQDVNQTVVPWSVTESELRDSLYKYSQHKVLHFTEIGHVALNSFRLWDKRKSHATHDFWRTTMFSAVH